MEPRDKAVCAAGDAWDPAYGERQVHNYANTTGSILEKLRLFVVRQAHDSLWSRWKPEGETLRDATNGAYPVNEIALAGAALASQAQ